MTGLEALSALEERVRAIKREVAAELAAREHGGLTPDQGIVLARLLKGPAPIGCLRPGVDPLQASYTAKQLAERGYVAIAPLPVGDRRLKLVSVTEAGEVVGRIVKRVLERATNGRAPG